MSTVKLEIKGNFLKITDNINDNDEVLISRIAKYFFSKNDTILNIRTEQGTNQVTYKYKVSVLVDGTDNPFASFAALETFLSENLGGNNSQSGDGSNVDLSNVSYQFSTDSGEPTASTNAEQALNRTITSLQEIGANGDGSNLGYSYTEDLNDPKTSDTVKKALDRIITKVDGGLF